MVESNLSSSGSVPYLCVVNVVMLCVKSCLVVPCNLPIAECSAEGFPFSVSGSGTPRVKLIEGPDHLRPIRCPSFIDLNDDHLTNTRFQAFAGRHPRNLGVVALGPSFLRRVSQVQTVTLRWAA